NMVDWLEQPVASVAAHPEDETIGMGAQLTKLREPMLMHITDGAPRNMGPAREEYAGRRRDELTAALRAGGAHSVDRREIGMVDQESSLNLPGLTARLTELFIDRQPAVVLTHPSVGGHPDYDAASFAVRGAVESIRRRGK